MIPTVFVVGLVIGRWWAVVLGAIGWPLLVVTVGDCGWSCIPEAVLLGAANAAVGVLVHRAGRSAVRALRRAY